MGKASREKKRTGKISGSAAFKSKDTQSGPSENETSSRLKIVAVLIAVITFMVFLPALQNNFVNWDDNLFIYENPFVHSMNAEFFRAAFLAFYISNWHPLTWISHAIDCAAWGLNPLGHHLTNVILHAINTFLVVFLAVRLIQAARNTRANDTLLHPSSNDRTILVAGALTGLLFGLHPLHVESVAWVSERKELLCALFFLLSILSYAGYASSLNSESDQKHVAPRSSRRQYLLAIGFFVLSLMSKPMAVSLPLVLLILDWYPFRRIQSIRTAWTVCVEKIPFIAFSLISSAVTILAQKSEIVLREFIPLSTRLLVAAESLLAYLLKIILPLNLIPFYPYPVDAPLHLTHYVLQCVLLLVITAICIAVARKHRLWIAAWAYFLITLLPVLGIIQVGGQAMADRYAYLPSLGPFLVLGFVSASLYDKAASSKQGSPMKTACIVTAGLALILISYATVHQIGVWRNSITLWSYVIEKEPGKAAFAYTNLGNAYKSEGQIDAAIEQYRAALALDPDDIEAHHNLGIAYKSKGQLDLAIEQYQAALRLKPDYAAVLNNLGNAYQLKGLLDLAIEQYQAALTLKPDMASAHYNLGMSYMKKGLNREAATEFKTVLNLQPQLIQARQALDSLGK